MDWDTARRTFQTAVIWIAVAALALLLWHIRQGVLLMFGTVVVAVLLHVLASFISDWTRMPHAPSLAVATGIVIAVIGVMAWRFGTQLSSQFADLMQNIEGGARYLQTRLSDSGFDSLMTRATEEGTSFITSSISSALSIGLTFVQAAIVVTVGAVYLAAQPGLYRDGFAKLFRPERRPRVMKSIDLIGRTLRLWLLGQLILMLLIGILTFIAVWMIGLPNALALALIAGLLEIVPYIGAFVSALPAVLVALTLGFVPALWTAFAYLAIQTIEGYVTTPLIERRFVTIPPALVLAGIVVSSMLFGAVGVILAAPMTVVVYVAVKMIYVEDPLDESPRRI